MQACAIRSAARGILIQDGRLLTVRYRDDRRGEFFVTPGGGQRKWETLHETVKREMLEEAGVNVTVGRLRFVREFLGATGEHNALADIHGLELFFECAVDGDAGQGAPAMGHEPDPDQIGVEWMGIRQLNDVRFFPRAMVEHLPVNGGAWPAPGTAPVYLGATR
ncbi:MAG: NUDIX domain-containing protein [Planctomycetes bacterium]|nr:NUDIX domain-containing protein [Planctomycetota bacterium]